MSGEPRTTNLMVDALLATHQLPTLSEDFADRVLAAAQSSRAGPHNGSPWPRRNLRPWRRSPLWLGFIALNIVAASAVAAIVSGIPVWHPVTEIVQKVTHGWYRAPVHSAPHRVSPRQLISSRPPANSSPMTDNKVTLPQSAAVLPLATQEAIGPVRQFHPVPTAIAGRGYHHTGMMLKRSRQGPMLFHPKSHLRAHPHQVKGSEFPITEHRFSPEILPRVNRDHATSLAKPPGLPLPREPRLMVKDPPVPYGPKLEPQGALLERRGRARWRSEISIEVRAERRRERALDHAQRGQGAPSMTHPHRLHLPRDRIAPHRRRFNF